MKKFGRNCGVNMDLNYELDYLPDADQDLEGISEYLSQFYESTFPNFMLALHRQIGNLRAMPNMGMRYKRFRRLVVSDYLVFYKVDDEKRLVTICAILHGAQNFEARLPE